MTGIQDLKLCWAAGQQMLVTVQCTPAPGRKLSDWDSFVLTIREDPEWPRSGNRLTVPLDPANAGGTPAVQATGVPDASPGINVVFQFVTPSSPGDKRYALDVWGIGGIGPVQFFPTTWLTITPSTR